MTASLAAGFNPLDATSVIAATGLIGIFCVLVAETGLLIGFFLPGDSLLFSAGLLAATHGSLHLPLGGVLAVAAAGAVVGAQIGFWIGRTLGVALLNKTGRPALPRATGRPNESIDRVPDPGGHNRRESILMRGLKERVILVAGGAGGIGTATCLRLGEEGARVLVADLNAEAAQAVATQIRAAGGTAESTNIDLSDEASVIAAIDLAVSTYGGLDVLHANAADTSVTGQDTDIGDVPLEIFDRTIEVNLRGHLLCARHAIPKLIERGGGSLIFTSSIAAYLGESERASYAISKSGLGGLVRHIARRWGKQGIRANAVAPGIVLTPAIREMPDPTWRDMAMAMTLVNRFGETDDIAAMVAFLASDDSGWITGQILNVDGGAILRA